MRWYSKYYGQQDYVGEQELYATLHATLGLPEGMVMLLGDNKVLEGTVYITLPHPKYLPMFQGFAESDAPTEKNISALYHNNGEASQYIRIRGKPLR